MTKNEVTLRDVYAIVKEMKADISGEIDDMKGAVRDLKKSFDDLETGRLTRLETKYAELMGEKEGLKAAGQSQARWIAFVISAIGIVINLAIQVYLKGR